MKYLSFIILSVAGMAFCFSPSASAGVNYIQYKDQYMADKDAPAAPLPTEQGSQFWHRSKYQREQAPAMGTEVPTTHNPGQKYDRPDWAPK